MQGITASKICLNVVSWIRDCIGGCRRICPSIRAKNKEKTDRDKIIENAEQSISQVNAQVTEPRSTPEFTIPIRLEVMRKGYHERQGLDCCQKTKDVGSNSENHEEAGVRDNCKLVGELDEVEGGDVDKLVHFLGEALKTNRKMCSKQLQLNESLPDPSNSMYRDYQQRHLLQHHEKDSGEREAKHNIPFISQYW